MQCRLILDSDEKRERAHKMGVTDPKMIYGIEDMWQDRSPSIAFRVRSVCNCG